MTSSLRARVCVIERERESPQLILKTTQPISVIFLLRADSRPQFSSNFQIYQQQCHFSLSATTLAISNCIFLVFSVFIGKIKWLIRLNSRLKNLNNRQEDALFLCTAVLQILPSSQNFTLFKTSYLFMPCMAASSCTCA